MGKAAKVVHGREHGVPVAHGNHTPLGFAACPGKNFYKFLMGRLDTKAFGLKEKEESTEITVIPLSQILEGVSNQK